MGERDLSQLREQVAELGRRVDEQATLVRKTQASVASLADSVAQVVTRQRRSDRSLALNSFVAYVLFTVLLGGGFFLLYQTRTGAIMDDRDAAVRERDAVIVQRDEAKEELAMREAGAQTAYEFYALLRDGKRSEAIARHGEIDRQALTPTERELFSTGVTKARSEIVDAGYLAGLDAFRRSDYDKAVTDLKRGLAYQGEGARAAQMRYYLGVALHKKGESEEAVRHLELALAGGVEQAGVTDARFYLAAALERLGRFADARAEYDKFASANPRSNLAFAARRKSAQLARAAMNKN